MTVWVYADTSKHEGDVDHLKLFDTEDAAKAWIAQHDPEGVASEYLPAKPSPKLKLELKDWLVLVPAIGTGLALTYQAGSFIPLGGAAFGLFSLTDHLIW